MDACSRLSWVFSWMLAAGFWMFMDACSRPSIASSLVICCFLLLHIQPQFAFGYSAGCSFVCWLLLPLMSTVDACGRLTDAATYAAQRYSGCLRQAATPSLLLLMCACSCSRVCACARARWVHMRSPMPAGGSRMHTCVSLVLVGVWKSARSSVTLTSLDFIA